MRTPQERRGAEVLASDHEDPPRREPTMLVGLCALTTLIAGLLALGRGQPRATPAAPTPSSSASQADSARRFYVDQLHTLLPEASDDLDELLLSLVDPPRDSEYHESFDTAVHRAHASLASACAAIGGPAASPPADVEGVAPSVMARCVALRDVLRSFYGALGGESPRAASRSYAPLIKHAMVGFDAAARRLCLLVGLAPTTRRPDAARALESLPTS
jgi:hypothetical protein